MEIDDQIKDLKKQIKELEAKKGKGSFKEKIKKSAKAFGQSSKVVFNALGKATEQVFTGVEDIDDTLRRLPQ